MAAAYAALSTDIGIPEMNVSWRVFAGLSQHDEVLEVCRESGGYETTPLLPPFSFFIVPKAVFYPREEVCFGNS